MKLKINKKFSLLAGALAMAAPLVLAACGVNNEGTAGDSKTDRIVVALTDPDNPRWVQARKDLVNQLSSFKDTAGETYKVNSNITKKQEEQTSYAEGQLNVSPTPKAMVVGAVDDGAANLATKAKEKKVSFIAYDRLINGTRDYHYYSTFDNAKVGEMQGLWLAGKLVGNENGFTDMKALEDWLNVEANKTKIKALENHEIYPLAGSQTDNNSKLFFGGANGVIEKLKTASGGKIKFVEKGEFEQAAVPNWDYTAAGTRVAAFLSGNNASKVKAFLAPNDGMAEAIINELTKAKKDPKKYFITGQDANANNLKFIKEGKQGMTIGKPDKWMARVIAIWANQVMTKEYDANPSKETVEAIFKIIQEDATIKKYAKEEAKLEMKDFIKLDLTQYKPEKSKDANTKVVTYFDPVKTFLLTPTLIDINNVDTFITK